MVAARRVEPGVPLIAALAAVPPCAFNFFSTNPVTSSETLAELSGGILSRTGIDRLQCLWATGLRDSVRLKL